MTKMKTLASQPGIPTLLMMFSGSTIVCTSMSLNHRSRKLKITAVKKMTIRSLAKEFEKLKEEVEELRPLKQKVAELEEKPPKVLCMMLIIKRNHKGRILNTS